MRVAFIVIKVQRILHTHTQIQLYGFNKELYHNMSEAQHKSQGIVGISLMVQIGETPNPELRIITSTFNKVMFRGTYHPICGRSEFAWKCSRMSRSILLDFPGLIHVFATLFSVVSLWCAAGASTPIRHISLRSLLPNTDAFMTYEGSTTHPGCWESTVWIILNKPIYITKQELYALRRLMQGNEQTPKAPLGNNARPLQPLHHRTVRTNIDFQSQKVSEHAHWCDVQQ